MNANGLRAVQTLLNEMRNAAANEAAMIPTAAQLSALEDYMFLGELRLGTLQKLELIMSDWKSQERRYRDNEVNNNEHYRNESYNGSDNESDDAER